VRGSRPLPELPPLNTRSSDPPLHLSPSGDGLPGSCSPRCYSCKQQETCVAPPPRMPPHPPPICCALQASLIKQAFEALVVNEVSGLTFEPDAQGKGMTDGQQVGAGSSQGAARTGVLLQGITQQRPWGLHLGGLPSPLFVLSTALFGGHLPSTHPHHLPCAPAGAVVALLWGLHRPLQVGQPGQDPGRLLCVHVRHSVRQQAALPAHAAHSGGGGGGGAAAAGGGGRGCASSTVRCTREAGGGRYARAERPVPQAPVRRSLSRARSPSN